MRCRLLMLMALVFCPSGALGSCVAPVIVDDPIEMVMIQGLESALNLIVGKAFGEALAGKPARDPNSIFHEQRRIANCTNLKSLNGLRASLTVSDSFELNYRYAVEVGEKRRKVIQLAVRLENMIAEEVLYDEGSLEASPSVADWKLWGAQVSEAIGFSTDFCFVVIRHVLSLYDSPEAALRCLALLEGKVFIGSVQLSRINGLGSEWNSLVRNVKAYKDAQENLDAGQSFGADILDDVRLLGAQFTEATASKEWVDCSTLVEQVDLVVLNALSSESVARAWSLRNDIERFRWREFCTGMNSLEVLHVMDSIDSPEGRVPWWPNGPLIFAKLPREISNERSIFEDLFK